MKESEVLGGENKNPKLILNPLFWNYAYLSHRLNKYDNSIIL